MNIDMSSLTLREKIGQTVITLCTPELFNKKCGNAENFIKRYPIGGLFPCGGLENGLMNTIPKDEFNKNLNEYNKYSKVPLIAACDGANDTEGVISVGNLMVLGAANDLNLAYEYGYHMGEKISSCNLHWWFEPVVDLNMSKDSPIINVRSLSDSVSVALPIAKAIIRGIQDSGVAATAKHFPGTDDKECIDPHLAPVNNGISKNKWDRTNGKMYKGLFEENVMSVMIGHQNLPCYQSVDANGKYLPSTLSSAVVSNLLKDKLGFRGVAVTDALVMGGFVGAEGIKNQVKSFVAGNDVLLWPDLEYMDLLEKEILEGHIPMSRLDDAVSRVLNLKEKIGILDGSFHKHKFNQEKCEEVINKICEKAVTLVQDPNNVLSDFSTIKKVLIVGVTPSDNCYNSLYDLKDEFCKKGICADIQRDIWQDELNEKINDYDMVIFALSRVVHQPIGPLEFWGENASSIWASNGCDSFKTIIVSFGDPYAFRYYSETDKTYINAYSNFKPMFRAVVRAILGEIPFQGVSPVSL